MFQKFAPLIVLALFAGGVYFMMQGMNNAIDMADHTKVKAKQEQKK
jgi:preprotein translocase subunit SecF